MNKKVVLLAFMSVLLSTALSLCAIDLLELQIVYASPYTNIDVATAYNMITSGLYPNLVVLDVRTQSEYDSGHIYGAVWIPHTELEARIGELAGHEDHEIIVYCRSGGRSVTASGILDSHGFTKVYNMLGGISAWKSAGYPVWIATVHNVNTTFNYDTIQAAIDAPQTLDGHTIFVEAGTYYENVVVNKILSLIGESRNNTIINGYYTYKTSVLLVTTEDARISGFTIQNGWCGIAVYFSNGCIITENRIMNNTYCGGGPQIVESGRGVWLIDSQNCTVIANIIDSNDRNVSLEGANNNTIMDNTVTNSLVSWGIVLESSHNNSISNNVIKYSVYDGIYLAGASNNDIVANFITDNGDEGIYIGGSSNNKLIKNIVENNPGEGILLDWANNNMVIGNTLINNKKRGILVWHSAYTIVYHNNFINNFWGQAYSNVINSWDNGYPSGGNYWSDYAGADEYHGPDQDIPGSDGIGDTPCVIEENNQDRYPLMNPWGTGTPVANFTWVPSIPKVGESVTFDASSSISIGGEIVGYEWNFGDAHYGFGKTATHTYTSSGTYTVTLNVTDSEGLWDAEQKQIQVVQPHGPKAEFEAIPDTVLLGEPIKFDASASLPRWNGTYEMPITEYRWDFGGGIKITTSASTVYYSFISPGIYYVTLTVFAPGATPETDSTTHKVTIVSVPVGGYSFLIKEHTTTKPLTLYLALVAILTTVFTTIKRKTHRRTKHPRTP